MEGKRQKGKALLYVPGTEFMSLLEIEDKERLLYKKVLFVPRKLGTKSLFPCFVARNIFYSLLPLYVPRIREFSEDPQ